MTFPLIVVGKASPYSQWNKLKEKGSSAPLQLVQVIELELATTLIFWRKKVINYT